MTSKTENLHRVVSGMGHLHRRGDETAPFHSTVSEMVHLHRMTSDMA